MAWRASPLLDDICRLFLAGQRFYSPYLLDASRSRTLGLCKHFWQQPIRHFQPLNVAHIPVARNLAIRLVCHGNATTHDLWHSWRCGISPRLYFSGISLETLSVPSSWQSQTLDSFWHTRPSFLASILL